MFRISKLSQYLPLAGLSLLIGAIPVTAATVTFDLDFFDDSGAEVGDGQFSYDDEETLTCLQITNSFDCFPESSFEELSVQEISDLYMAPVTILNNVLTDFSANIYGIDWNESYETWWSDDETEQLPGQISVSRSGSFASFNSWFFGDPFLGTEQFLMNFDSSSDTFGEGTWFQSLVEPVFPNPDSPFETGGTWQATRVTSSPASASETVPEPSTIVGTLMAMVFVYLSQCRLGRNRSC